MADTIRDPERRRKIRIKLYNQQGGCCHLCGQRMKVPAVTFDHIIPKSFGGENKQDNLKLAHFECNNRRGDRWAPELPWLTVSFAN